MKTRQGLEGIRDSCGNVLSHKKNILSQEHSGDFKALNSSMQEHNKEKEKEKEVLKTKIKSDYKQILLKSDLSSNHPHHMNMNAQSDTSESLDNMLLEMCKHLESQNDILEQSNEELRQIIKEKENTTVEDIIPHYRLAIIRYGHTVRSCTRTYTCIYVRTYLYTCIMHHTCNKNITSFSFLYITLLSF